MRKHEMEVEVDATEAQVWEAVSTSEGIASWFAPIVKVAPGAGGSVTVAWDPSMEGTQRIEVWEPNKHIQIVGDREGGAPPSVVDYYVEGRGGKTVMRLVHSGFDDTAKFDGEFEATGGAWPAFLKMLKHSVERGVSTCRNVTLFRMLAEPREAAWEKLTSSLPELKQPELQAGVSLHFNAAKGSAIVEFPERNHALLCVFCEKCGGVAMLTLVWLLYGESESEAQQVRERWATKLDELFPEPQAEASAG